MSKEPEWSAAPFVPRSKGLEVLAHESRGKRRLHNKPTTTETLACHPGSRLTKAEIRARIVFDLKIASE